jgi:hypothetical protein
MFPALALATVAITFSLRRLFPAIATPEEGKLPYWHNADLPSLYGLPIADFRPVRAFFLAIYAQAALLLAIADRPLLAGIFLSICLSLLVWRWTALTGSAIKQFAGSRQSVLLSLSLRHRLHHARAPSLGRRKIVWLKQRTSQARPDHS